MCQQELMDGWINNSPFIVVVALHLLIPRRPANGTGDGRRPLLVV